MMRGRPKVLTLHDATQSKVLRFGQRLSRNLCREDQIPEAVSMTKIHKDFLCGFPLPYLILRYSHCLTLSYRNTCRSKQHSGAAAVLVQNNPFQPLSPPKAT